jgi:phosphate transport system permease protein
MAVTTTDPGAVDLREPSGWRQAKNRLAIGGMWFAFLCLVVPLGFVLVGVIVKGASKISWSFLTSSTIPPPTLPPLLAKLEGSGGIGAAILGTLEITAFASVIAIPLGILGAVYLSEYGGNRPLARLLSFLSDVMTGVPSIVMGLFIFTVWVIPHGLTGLSGMAGSFALACLMLPIVIRSSYEMLRLVPDSLRQGSYALGATKARVTLTVVLPSAAGGIVSGALLAVARAAGETAPLLFTIGVVTATNANLFSGPNTALSTLIFSEVLQPYPNAVAFGWGAALTLIAIAFILMIAARLVTARFNRYSR